MFHTRQARICESSSWATHLQVYVVCATIPGVCDVSTVHDLSKNVAEIIPRYLRVIIEVWPCTKSRKYSPLISVPGTNRLSTAATQHFSYADTHCQHPVACKEIPDSHYESFRYMLNNRSNDETPPLSQVGRDSRTNLGAFEVLSVISEMGLANTRQHVSVDSHRHLWRNRVRRKPSC